jgi:hypothetical protein
MRADSPSEEFNTHAIIGTPNTLHNVLGEGMSICQWRKKKKRGHLQRRGGTGAFLSRTSNDTLMYDLHPRKYYFSNADSHRSEDADQLLQSQSPMMANHADSM